MNETFNVLPCGYLSFKDDGVVSGCNTTLLSWLGYSNGEIVGKKFENILSLASRIFYQTHFFPLVRLSSKAHEIFLLLRAKDGTDVPVLVNAERSADHPDFLIRCVFFRVEERNNTNKSCWKQNEKQKMR